VMWAAAKLRGEAPPDFEAEASDVAGTGQAGDPA
jgi:hypothetical protein